MEKNTIVINLIGAPGTGKSSTAADVFARLKWSGIDCELISEFAKELVWEQRHETFKDEIYLFAKQNHRLFRVDGKVDVIVTDRPIVLSMYYNQKYGSNSKAFDALVLEEHNRYNNINIMLQRKKEYNPNGRNQTQAEADEMQIEIENLLKDNDIEYFKMDANKITAKAIVNMIIDLK